MRSIRSLMAESLDRQTRLDRIVELIARNMVAEVCSLYVLRADSVLELYATQGLNPGSVHLAQLRLGEGLVGTIAATARPLNLAQAQHHPAFTYIPETGEEVYNSFLGVPILRAGRTLGVLTVQNKAERLYREEESEALETVAMVVAEMIAAGGLEGLSRPGVTLDLSRPVTFSGLPLSDGIGLGHVVLHEPRVIVTNLFNEHVDDEIERLNEALAQLRKSIEDMISRRDVSGEGEHRAVLEAYRMFAYDRGWVRRLEEAVRNGLTAEGAVEKVQSDMRARMMHLSDAYIRERLHDFDDLANRLLRQLIGHAQSAIYDIDDAILVARNMGAAQLLDYRRDRLRALVLEEGAATSHVVIVARALGIPVVGQAAGIVSMAENGDIAIVDGEEGCVHLRPMNEVVDNYADKIAFRSKRKERYAGLRDKPPVTRDGVKIDLQMNAGLLVDLPHLEEAGAEGIGLFRTELQFMIASTMPRANDQQQLYEAVFEAAHGKPVTFRTLDVGGDKVLPYLAKIAEENPALGYRAVRLSLDRPALIRTQLRALMKAASGRELRFMVPMIADAYELHAVRAIVDMELAHLARFGYEPPKRLKFGAMLEVPSLLFQLDDIMPHLDFVSVGSNDLFQFFHAVDRGNPRVANRFSDLSSSFLKALKSVADAGRRHDVPVTLCGEMAGRPIAAMALLALGFRSISMAPPSLGPVKDMILALNVGAARTLIETCLAEENPASDLTPVLAEFAKAEGVPV